MMMTTAAASVSTVDTQRALRIVLLAIAVVMINVTVANSFGDDGDHDGRNRTDHRDWIMQIMSEKVHVHWDAVIGGIRAAGQGGSRAVA